MYSEAVSVKFPSWDPFDRKHSWRARRRKRRFCSWLKNPRYLQGAKMSLKDPRILQEVKMSLKDPRIQILFSNPRTDLLLQPGSHLWSTNHPEKQIYLSLICWLEVCKSWTVFFLPNLQIKKRRWKCPTWQYWEDLWWPPAPSVGPPKDWK